MKTYLVTGGAGFIGSNYVKMLFDTHKNSIRIVILDKLTYAGNLSTLEKELKEESIFFIKGDICNAELVEHILKIYDVDYIVNFAAESHVDRSIEDPKLFLETNIMGTWTLMEEAKKRWTVGKDANGFPIYQTGKKFLQVSTDEVYGSLELDVLEGEKIVLEQDVLKVIKDRDPDKIKAYGKGFFTEKTPLDPRSPYSASKTSADHIVFSYIETYKFPANITRCSNNYGPYQFPEKLIPLMINNVIVGKTLPVYGTGMNVRDWLYVDDHCSAIETVLLKGKEGEVYNIGGFNEALNLDIVKLILSIMKDVLDKNPKFETLLKCKKEDINESRITYVRDRLSHDKRYAIDPTKIVKELGWYPKTTFKDGIRKCIEWNLVNFDWIENVTSGDYQQYYNDMYKAR